MDPEQYPSNSHKSKQEPQEPEKRTGKVISGTAVVKKKTVGDKVKSIFIVEDLAKVKDYVITDVIIPNIKKAIDDIVSNGTHMILYGSGARPRSSSNTINANPSRVSYRSYYSNSDPRSEPRRDIFDFESITFDTRGEAELVIDTLVDLITSYGVARVSDYYEACGVSTNGNYMANDYGWKTLRDASTYRDNGRYAIRMPRPMPLR